MKKICTYRISVRHHSVADYRSLVILGSLTAAKSAATREFGGGFVDHEIVIFDVAANEIISTRRIADDRWIDREF